MPCTRGKRSRCSSLRIARRKRPSTGSFQKPPPLSDDLLPLTPCAPWFSDALSPLPHHLNHPQLSPPLQTADRRFPSCRRTVDYSGPAVKFLEVRSTCAPFSSRPFRPLSIAVPPPVRSLGALPYLGCAAERLLCAEPNSHESAAADGGRCPPGERLLFASFPSELNYLSVVSSM